MRILVLSARYPVRGGKGDQNRMWSFVSHLASRHDITVVTGTPAPNASARAALEALACVEEGQASYLGRLVGAGAAVLCARPAQTGWMFPRATARRARTLSPAADAVLINTVRSLPAGLDPGFVLDHVDALSLNMLRRAQGAEPPWTRAAARLDAALLRRAERLGAAAASGQVVTSGEDAAHLPSVPVPEIIPVAWDGPLAEPAGWAQRDIDVIFTGNMAYPPNREAALRIEREIAPRIRALRPDARIAVVGRNADQLNLQTVEVASDVADLHAWLSRAKVAIVPLSGGTGSPYKVIEAAACGAALVTRGWAAAQFGMDASLAETDDEFATATAALLDDPAAWAAAQARSRPALLRHSSAAQADRLEAVLVASATARGRI